MREKGYILVEGHGEHEASLNLVTRLWSDLKLGFLSWKAPLRENALYKRDILERRCNYIREQADAAALLVLRDADDDCPASTAPLHATWIADLKLPFPAALVLLRREFETLFLASLPSLRGPKTGVRWTLPEDVESPDNLESIRGAKEWLTRKLPRGVSYKPTLDQLALTRLLDFELLRASGLPSFGSLERGLRFLDLNRDKPVVYPGPLGGS